MTAHAMKGDRKRCLEADTDAYVSKPIDAKELLRAIDLALGASAGASRAPDAACGGASSSDRE